MIHDSAQKLKAIRYCVATGLVPFLEVIVEYEGDIGPAPSEITDIDVLGVRPADSLPLKRILFDCKTLKTSPINRALWAKGLACFIGADESFVILSKPTIESHRLAGGSIDVRLFSEEVFDVYAQSTSSDYAVPNSYIERGEAWEALSAIGAKYPALRGHVKLIQSTGPLSVDPAHGIRTLIASFRRAEGELDPGKAEHRAVFALTCMQLLLFFSELLRIFHNVFDPATPKAEFEQTLRYYVWGGRRNYEIRQRLKDLGASKRGEEGAAFDLPGWDTFVEVFRSLLDAPTRAGSTCLPLQDLAFRELSAADQALDTRLRARLTANVRVRQFINLAAQYLSAASKIPKEFRTELNRLVLEVSA